MTYYRTKNSYSYWLAFQLMTLFALIAYTVFNYESNPTRDLRITSIEVLFTFIFLIEIVLRIYVAKFNFLTNLWNVVDVINLFIIITIFGFSYVLPWRFSSLVYSEILPLAMLGVRYASQTIRILLEFRSVKHIQEAAKMDFQFDHHDEESKDIENLDLSVE